MADPQADGHLRPDGTPCPYEALGPFCNKCGWTALAVTVNDESGYPCPKDGAVLTLVDGGAWCPECHTVWRQTDEVSLGDLDG